MQKSQSDGGSSNSGIVTRSVAGLNNGIINDRRVTVPCTIKIDTFSQSTEKLQLKDGRGYYTLVKEDKLRYKIKDIKILRRRNRSVLVPWRKSYSRMNHRPHPNDRTGPYRQSQGSGIKRPLHSPPGEYSKQQRYGNDHNRHFSSPRGRGGGYGPRGSWNNGGYNNHRENRGGYQGSSPGSHYGNRSSYSPQGHSRSKDWRSPERQNREYRGDSYNNKPSYPRREPDTVERIPYRNGEAPRGKSLVSTYRNTTEKSVIIHDDSGPNNVTEKKKEAPRTSENESRKVSSDSLVSGEPNEAESLSKIGTSLPVGKTSSDKETKRKEVLTMSEQMDVLKGGKSKTVEGNQSVTQSAEDSKLSSAVNKDGNAQATVGPQKTEVAASNHVQEESNEKKKKLDPEVEEVKQNVPVKVHSARKSAPTSALSRTQRKQMLNRQKLLKSQQTEEKDTTGSPKARMGSRQSDTDDKDSDRDIQIIDSDECSSDVPAKSKRVEDISSPAQDPVPSDTKGGPAMEETSKDTEEPPTALEKKEEQLKGANLPGSIISSLSSNEKSSKTKLPGDEDSKQKETAEEPNCSTPEKLTSNTATKMSETSSIVKISSGKINEKGLQKIKDKLKKKLQEGKQSPSKGSLLRTQVSSSASTSSPSPEPQDFIKSKSETGPENETSVSTPGKEVDTKPSAVPEISTSLVTPNIVADLIAKDMLDSSDELDEDIDSSDSKENSVSITNEAKNKEQNNANEPTNTPASTAAESEVSMESAAIESSSPPPKSPEEVPMEVEDEEPEFIETSKHDDSVELVAVEEKQSADEDLDDISVDLGPEEPDDLDIIDDDILLEDQPEVSNGDSAISEISIAHVESQASGVEDTTSTNSQAEKILAAPSGTAQSEANSDTPSTKSQASISKRRLSDDELEEEPVSKKSKADEESPAEVKTHDEEVIDLESERSTAFIAPQPSENKPCGSGTENMIVFTQKEWKEFALSITDKYEKVVKMINQKTKEVVEKKEDLDERYSVLKQDYAVLQDKYDQLYSYAKKIVFLPKRTVEVQTDPVGKHNLSRMRRRSSKQTLAQKSANQPAENAQGSTSSGTSSPATSDAASSSSSSSSASTPSTSSAKGTNLDKKRQDFQAILNKVIKKGSSASDLGAVPVSPAKPSPPSGTSVPSPSKPSSDATKSDAKSSGPKSVNIELVAVKPVESQESNAAITASGKTFTAASQGSHSLASKSPPSSTDTTKLSTNASSAAKQATSSSPPQPQSKNETQNTKTAIPDAGKSASSVTVVLTKDSYCDNPARKSTEKQMSPPPESTTKGADSAKAGSSKSTEEPEVIDLTDDPDPPDNSTAGGRNQKKMATSPSSKHSTLTTRSPHTLVPQAQASTVKMAPTRVTTNSPLNRVVSSVGSAMQGNTAVTPGRDTSSGNKQSVMPARRSPSTSISSLQVGNVNVPSVSSQAQGANVRNQVVGLQHGQGQRAPANQVSNSRGNTSQVFTMSQQRLATMPPQQIPQKLPPGYTVATVSGVQVIPNQQGPAKQATVRLSLQQQQQQQHQQQQLISLQHLQQQRQGMHQLPGSAASAAALATRPPQATWMNQSLVSSASQVQMVQHVGQQQMALTTQQLQMLKSSGGTISSVPQAQTVTTSSLQARPQLAHQQQQQQLAARASQEQQLAARASQEQQIQAQQRAHAFNQAHAKNIDLKQQQEQQQQAAARQAAARIQSNQVGQQTTQQTQCRILNEEKRKMEILAQQREQRAKMMREQLSKLKGVRNKMKALEPPPAGLQEHQRKLREIQVQEKKCSRELQEEEETHRSCMQTLAEIGQQLTLLGASGLNTQLRQQQIHQQIQQQQQIPQNRLQQQQLQRVDKPPARISHPAPLPDLFQLPEVKATVRFTPAPLCPVLEIRHSPEGIVLSWKSDPKDPSKVGVKQYYLYAYQESESSQPSTDLWKKIGEVDALPLPMACTLTHFKAGSMYHFAVAAVSVHGRPGKFSNTGSINLP